MDFFLLENGFMRGKVDTTLFRREVSKESLCKDFFDLMKSEFKMMKSEHNGRELKFFLGLQIKQDNKGIFINKKIH